LKVKLTSFSTSSLKMNRGPPTTIMNTDESGCIDLQLNIKSTIVDIQMREGV